MGNVRIQPVPMSIDVDPIPVPQAPGGGFVQLVFQTPVGVFGFFVPMEGKGENGPVHPAKELRGQILEAERQLASGLIVPPSSGIIHPGNGQVRPIRDTPQA